MGAGTNTPAETGRYFSDFVEGRRGEILDAALAVFGEKGYEAGTMREIARRVGVTEPALYRHYEGKRAILTDIVSTAGDRISGEMRAALAGLSGENIVPMLLAMIEMRRRSLGGPASAQPLDGFDTTFQPGAGNVLGVLIRVAPHDRSFLALLREHLGVPMVETLRATVPRIDAAFGIERSAEDLENKIRVFMSLFAGYFTTSLLLDAPPQDSMLVDTMLDLMGWRAATVDGTDGRSE